jgi:hypothetical protein
MPNASRQHPYKGNKEYYHPQYIPAAQRKNGQCWRRKYEDFKDKIRKNVIIDANGCWLWQMYVQPITEEGKGGYGMCTDAKGKWGTVHRAVWADWYGPIPTGREVAHSCDVRHCCNPEHLWIATHRQNLDDCLRKGRR